MMKIINIILAIVWAIAVGVALFESIQLYMMEDDLFKRRITKIIISTAIFLIILLIARWIKL